MNRMADNSRKEAKRSFALLNMLDDNELVGLVKGGDPRAYHVLVERYDALVTLVVSKCLKDDRMSIEDACQETYLKALVRIDDLRNPERFKSWLCAIAHNQALDTLRQRKKIVSWNSTGWAASSDTDDAQPIWQIVDDGNNPAEIQDEDVKRDVIRDIIEDIPELYRDPMTMRFDDDLDYQVIADSLGKPLGTIKSLIHRGKAMVRAELSRRSGGADGAMILVS